MKFLDDSGLTKLWNKIKDGFVQKDSNNSISVNSVKGIPANSTSNDSRLTIGTIANSSAPDKECGIIINAADTTSNSYSLKIKSDDYIEIYNKTCLLTFGKTSINMLSGNDFNIYANSDAYIYANEGVSLRVPTYNYSTYSDGASGDCKLNIKSAYTNFLCPELEFFINNETRSTKSFIITRTGFAFNLVDTINSDYDGDANPGANIEKCRFAFDKSKTSIGITANNLRNNIMFQDKLIRFRVGDQSALKIELNTAKTPQTTIFHKLIIDSTGDIPNQVVIDTDSVLNMARIYRGTQNLYIGSDEDAGFTYIAGSVAGFDNINCSALEDEGAIAWKLLENSDFELGNSINNGNIYIWYNGKRYQLDISALISSGILK